MKILASSCKDIPTGIDYDPSTVFQHLDICRKTHKLVVQDDDELVAIVIEPRSPLFIRSFSFPVEQEFHRFIGKSEASIS